MDSYKSLTFFSNTPSHLVKLFEQVEFVWEALTHLESFLKTLPLGTIEGNIEDGVFIKERSLVYIGKGTVVESGAYIQGPCFIGNNCQIRHGAYLRGNVYIGDGAVVGHATEVKNSIFLNHAHAAHFNYVGDSILGNKVNLGAGSICANVRFDREGIAVGKERIPSKRKKLGAIIGDETEVGCNAILLPGALISKGSSFPPGARIRSNI